MEDDGDYLNDDDEDDEYTYSDDESDEPNAMVIDDHSQKFGKRIKRPFIGVTHNGLTNHEAVRKTDNNLNATPIAGTSGMDAFMKSEDSPPVHMLNSSDLVPIMKRRLQEVTEVLEIPNSAAAVLMREHTWMKEKLYESFYSNPEKVQKGCGVRARCLKVNQNKKLTAASLRNRKSCAICCDDEGYGPDEMLEMPCGHEFCRNCWRGFVDNMLSEGPVCVRTKCPQAGCSEVVTEEEVAEAAPDLLPKFESYQLRSFVELDRNSRWCPGPGCERVAIVGGTGLFTDSARIASCDCGTSFCLKCGQEPHAPVSCRDLVRWNEKCKNESETANWILANTKPCPKCSSRIEKNQGCNHMLCQQCRHEFCWICMGIWNDHGANTGGYYRCNKYDTNEENPEDQSDAAKAKRELDRYLHYYKRYHAHAEAQKFAKRQLRETETRMVLLQESSDNATWTDVEFLKAANEQLVDCRCVLKYTYAFAYYMTDDKSKAMQKERFEHHQEMLERFTEDLSELSEKPLAEMNRTDVVNQTRVVDRFMKNILKYVEEGMEE